MKSLRNRMLLAAGGTIVLCWVVALIVLATYLEQSQSSIADDELRAIAVKLLQAVPKRPGLGLDEPGLQLRTDPGVQREKMAFQVWKGSTRLLVRSLGAPASPLRPDFEEGFASTVVEGQRWRVYSASDISGQMHVQVGDLHSSIDAELRRDAFIAMGIATALLVLVGGFMWGAVRQALRPVADMEAALHRRQKFDLTPLSSHALPTELHPLVGAFNHVLVQLDEAVEGERRFIGDAAHELRTPLAALLTQAQVALRASTPAEKDAALLKLVVVAERSTRLSEQLLDLARLNAGAHAPQQSLADLSELAEHVAREFDMQAHQQQRSLLLDLRPCTIVCNIDEIGILVRNLLDNALRYTAAGGRVRMACGSLPEQGNAVFLEVADNGPGVPESEREAIFKRFHRVPGSTVRGSGIGLSLVAGIAHLHRATITTGSGLGGSGLCVRVVFPAARDSAG